MTPRNLLGRLNARTPDDLQRIAAFWLVPLPGSDRGRHVGALYRVMTDVRYARSVWERLDPNAQTIVRDLASADAGALTIDQIVEFTGLSKSVTRDAAIRLFQAGILAREGDNQELPVGALPKLFLPREIGQIFGRVQDEIDAGNLSASALRVMLETLDDPELEEAAAIWGLSVIPGQRRRSDLVAQILRQIATPDRVDQVLAGRGRSAAVIWSVVRAASPSPIALQAALKEANLVPAPPSSPNHARDSARVESALAELEEALLVFHTYLRDGTRWLFVPHEIANPGEVAATIPLRQLQPLPEDKAPEIADPAPHTLAWDVLTVLREISEHGAPLWIPGESMSRPWQRRLNRRLWSGGDEVPPTGYLGFLLYLGVAVNVISPSDQPLPVGTEKSAIRPIVSRSVREWTRLSFEAQSERMKQVWLDSDVWLEGRERQEIDVWGADWRGFRTRLLDAIAELDDREWLLIEDLSARLAEQNPTMIGPTFTAASARAARSSVDERAAAIAQVIAVELETALSWFGLVQIAHVPGMGLAVRAARPPAGEEDAAAGPVIELTEGGLVTLLRPAPLHVWSLSAFGDAEGLRPHATFQLRPGSVSRALAAGFDLDQIIKYLETQSGSALPEQVLANLRDWTVGYRRVRMRRAMVLDPDSDDAIPNLRTVITAAGHQVLEELTPDGGLVVMLAPSADPNANPEEDLLATLRAGGYVGQWEKLQRTPGRP